MNKSIIAGIIFTTYSVSAYAQEKTEEIKAFELGNQMINSIKSSREYISIFNQLLSHTDYFKYKNYADMIAWWSCYVGLPEKAIEIEDRIFPRKTTPETFRAANFSMKDAISTIVEKGGIHQVVMVNEEHRMSRHRVLTAQLLQPLYEKGYRYLAIEALLPDSSIHKERQPFLRSGTYTKDPVFAEMLRMAIKIGYRLVAYDLDKIPEEYKTMNAIQRQMFREEAQAKNIINRILKDDPNAKIIVHGGRDHIAEMYEMQSMGNDSIRVGVMAGAFKYFTGIDPFTIDQLRNAEHSDTTFESAVFKWVRTQKNVSQQNILLHTTSGKLLADKGNLYDVALVPSLTRYTNGRPDWLIHQSGRKKVTIDVTNYQPVTQEYFLVQAIYKNEDQDLAVPADQYAYQKDRKNVLMLLKKGVYIIRILDEKGNILKSSQENVR